MLQGNQIGSTNIDVAKILAEIITTSTFDSLTNLHLVSSDKAYLDEFIKVMDEKLTSHTPLQASAEPVKTS